MRIITSETLRELRRCGWALGSLSFLALWLFFAQAAGARGPVPTHRAPAANARVGAPTAYRRYRHYRARHAHRRRSRLHQAPRARAAVVGGALASVEEVPWQVYVFAEADRPGTTEKVPLLGCGGSIIDLSHILTAAHCAFDPETGELLPAADFHVVAGVSSTTAKEIKEGPTVQARLVESVRIHPYYGYRAEPPSDDVDVLRLAEPLKESAAVQPIALSSSSAAPPEGTSALLSGYGLEKWSTQEHNDKLYSLPTTLSFPRPCGGEDDALFLCASNAGGSACLGDSGGGLIQELNGADRLIGIVDSVGSAEGEVCGRGALNGFVNVAAPEIRDFIEGSENPPLAPRGGGVSIRGVVTAGHSLTCEPGSWSNGPTFSYAFVNRADGQVLQDGASPVYSLTQADVGRAISCEVMASNAGGTGRARTGPLPAIKSAPAAQGSGTAQSAPAASAPESPNPAGEAAAGVSASEIAALLRKEITPAGKSAKIASLLKATGFTISFKALEAGSAAIEWYQLPPGAKLTGKTRAKPVLIASGRKNFSRAGTAKIRIKLTAAGKRLLKSAKRLKLTAKGTFTPTGKGAVSVTKTFVLSA